MRTIRSGRRNPRIDARRLGSCLAAWLLWSAAQPVAAAEQTVLRGATVIDATGAAAIADGVVVMRGAHLDCVGAASDCPASAGAKVIDVAGAWITPGLVDSHVHFSQTGWADGRPDAFDLRDVHPYAEVIASLQADPQRWYRSYLCSGITAVFDVGGYPWTWDLRDDDADALAVHVAAAGPLLSHMQPPALRLAAEQQFVALTDPQAGREAVRYLAAFASDAVKVWFIEPPEAQRAEIDARVEAVGEAARAIGLPPIVHATERREAKVALAAGARLLVHSVSDAPVDQQFLELAREAGASHTPTLIVAEGYYRLYRSIAEGALPPIDDPNGCIDPDTRRKTDSGPEYRDRPAVRRFAADRLEAMRSRLDREAGIMAENLRRVHAAGIPVATGTDAGNPLTFHGPAIYAEMERMQAAGLTPAEVLLASTRNGARAMGRSKDFGTLEPGKRADLLVVEADPLADIANLRRLKLVVREGVIHSVDRLAW